MKKSLVALALMGAFSAAYAQSSVTIYGTLDAGIIKRTGATVAEGKRDNNKLGFKGVEDLGSGLKALFQLEIRYEPDTGTIEGTTRPLFQGQSRVGLQGDFGTVRLGRGLTAFQESITAFEPWAGMPNPAGFQTDLQVAGYVTTFGSGSDPLGPAGNSGNRFSNAVWYNSPVFGGMFQINTTLGTKENDGLATAIIGHGTAAAPQYPVGANGVAPYSISATATNGPGALMLAYERNAVETKFWSIAGSVKPIEDLKLMASYQQQDQTETVLINPKTKAWVLGANYTVGVTLIRAGYGQKTPDNVLNNPNLVKTKQASLGADYNLSPRTYLYVEGSNKRQATVINTFAMGIHHNF